MNDKRQWQTVKFGDVVKLNKERCANPLEEGIERYVGLEHIEPEDLRIRRWGLVSEGTTFTNLFRPGQVLFGKRRAYQRKVAVADFTGVCSGDIYAFESKDPSVLLPELLPFICQTDGFFDHAVGTSAGSLSPRTNWTQLAQYEFALPPLDEQRRIADLLESLNACVIEMQQLYKSHDKLYDSFMASCYDRARDCLHVVNVRDICREVTVGIVVTPSKYFANSGVLAISHSNIMRGEIDTSGADIISTMAHGQLSKTWLYEGDIVLPRVSTIAGKPYYAAIVPHELNEINSIGIIILRPNLDKVDPLFLESYLNSPQMRRRLVGIAVGSIQRQLNVGIIAQEMIRLPPLEEQLVIGGQSMEIKNALQKTRYQLQSRVIAYQHYRETVFTQKSMATN